MALVLGTARPASACTLPPILPSAEAVEPPAVAAPGDTEASIEPAPSSPGRIRALRLGRGLAIASATLAAGGMGLNALRYRMLNRGGADIEGWVLASLGAGAVNTGSIVFAGFAGDQLGRYAAPHSGAKAMFGVGIAMVSVGVVGSVVWRVLVPAQTLGALIDGSALWLERPGHYIALEAATLTVATGAALWGFGGRARGARLAASPLVDSTRAGLVLSGRF